VIPSIDLDQAVLDRHARELAALEERSLYLLFALRRAGVRLVVVTSLPVQAEVLEYYLRLIPDADEPRARIELLSPDDDSPRPLARKILERSDLLARLAELVPHSDRAFILPFNVRGCERDLALALDLPIYGIDHRFARYGTKTGARRLFESAGVSHPAGVDGLHGGAEVADAVISLRHTQPGLEGAVVKHDDAVSGDGNRIIPLRDLPPSGTAEEVAELDVRLRSLSQSYREKLGDGGIVEELIVGETRSPSVQLRIPPGGDPLVISTHDQVLGGELNQTFVACRFPARPDYAGRIVSEAQKAGEYLAAEGVAGRIGLDFVVVRRDGTWAPYAVEINLHMGVPRTRTRLCGCSPMARSMRPRRPFAQRLGRRSTTSPPTGSAITGAIGQRFVTSSRQRRPQGSIGTRSPKRVRSSTCFVYSKLRAASA
jgi:hypothetical protein